MGRHDAKMKAEIGVILLQAKGPQRLSAKPQKWGEPGIEPASGSGGTSPSHTLTSDSRPPDRERMTLLSKLSRLWSSAGPPQAPDHSCPLWTAHGQHLPASTENLTPSLVVGQASPGSVSPGPTLPRLDSRALSGQGSGRVREHGSTGWLPFFSLQAWAEPSWLWGTRKTHAPSSSACDQASCWAGAAISAQPHSLASLDLQWKLTLICRIWFKPTGFLIKTRKIHLCN